MRDGVAWPERQVALRRFELTDFRCVRGVVGSAAVNGDLS